ncbi:sensor histidine kinase [Thiocystis violascens]|uniref:histidine kinase n=1 Tax=Thiocystis violascens (strain ATCC 17096 / DSM 198 / 6111) TaxID=765911 RepID=I3Y829_THIV6|nr:HAMP domain-containing sensor histidine kinase [Thiocystis violascens]AFL73147.1 histidine kinase [Thiocystis violascens DSM 198]
MDFSDILASSIHDIKNSLGLILNDLDDLITNPDNRLANPRQAILLQHEAQRANCNLIQLLNLYRLGNRQLVARIAEYHLDDFLQETIAESQAICQALGIDLSYDCDPDLTGYFDAELIHGVLDSTIGNARRYTHRKILLSAVEQDGYLVIRVEDDGPGFPGKLPQWLPDEDESARNNEEAPATDRSRTRLGLYFAARVAQLHRNAERTGRICLQNGHTLKGSCFEMWLP